MDVCKKKQVKKSTLTLFKPSDVVKSTYGSPSPNKYYLVIEPVFGKPQYSFATASLGAGRVTLWVNEQSCIDALGIVLVNGCFQEEE